MDLLLRKALSISSDVNGKDGKFELCEEEL
jgi:hypothetical protein